MKDVSIGITYLYPTQITRISDSRESPDSRESCESIRANHATKRPTGPAALRGKWHSQRGSERVLRGPLRGPRTPLRDPLRHPTTSQNLSSLLALFLLPLNLAPTSESLFSRHPQSLLLFYLIWWQRLKSSVRKSESPDFLIRNLGGGQTCNN